MNLERLHQYYLDCNSVSTDTRKIADNCMYFALKGDNFNGNTFVDQAFQKGAKYCVVDDKGAVINENCILVEDTLSTLQQLARFHRNYINISIIGLTGSNGKTTTKELIYSVLSSKYKVMATLGNLNNHIGVPLTLLRFTKDLDFGIVEMGANHQKEIEFLSDIARPDFGLITNFGKAHLEGFGSIEGVIKGKSELYRHLQSNNKMVFINTDDKQQLQQIKNYTKTTTFGSSKANDCVVQLLSANPNVKIKFDGFEIESQLIGEYNYGNIAVAIAVGHYFKVSKKHIKNAIENYKPTNNRSEIIKRNKTNIILDAYNANPTSMLAAIKNFSQLDSKNKFLFLGDMFELGKDAGQEHQAITDLVEDHFDKNIFLIGENFYKTKTKPDTLKYSSFSEFQKVLKTLNLSDATLLIKGSRGMALEQIVENL